MTSKTLLAETDTELLPCPFCGGKPYVFEREGQRPDESTFSVHCDECEATHHGYRDKIVSAWNTRAAGPAQAPIKTTEGGA